MNPERLFESDLKPGEIQEILCFFGFRDWKQADLNLISLLKMLGGDAYFLKTMMARMFGILKNVSDPDRAFNNFLRFLENTPSSFMNFNFITHHPAITRLVFRIFSDSQYFSDILVRHPDYLEWLIHYGLGNEKNPQELLHDALLSMKPFQNPESKTMALRRFQKREMLRIGANDLLEKFSHVAVTRQLSHLADTCIHCLYEIKKEAYLKNGQGNFEFTVIAMGKLGGQELNYSSDIDLIFAAKGDLFQAGRMASEICRDLTAFSAEGYFYRVDTRLRPEGDRGQLVQSLEGFERYFENRARVWEKQAYLKARPCAGDEKPGKVFMLMADRFIFKKYLTLEEINAIKKLKKSIENKAHENRQWKREVKIGYGGIRDIEFFVQLIQLLYGGKYPRLKTPNTLRALELFFETGLIGYGEQQQLYRHYVFLRRIEHFLQIMDYQQTHLLPEKEEKRIILSVKMGYKNLRSFEKDYDRITGEVREIFKKYFEDVFEDQKEKLSELLMHAKSPEEIEDTLKEYGFEDSRRVFHLLKNPGINIKNELRFYSIIEEIFDRLKENAFLPEKGLLNLLRIVRAYRGEDVFFDIIRNSPRFLNTLIRIASFSDFLVEIIEKNPAVLDFLTEEEILLKPSQKKNLDEILTYLEEDMPLEQALKTLYEMEVFRIGTKDILSLSSLEETGKNLFVLAKTIFLKALKASLPPDFPVAVIFFGKMAGKEMSYHSDLDLMALCPNSDFETLSKASLSLQETLKKLKGIYEVDLRLRPGGKNAPIVISVEAFEKYLQEKAENWEKLVYIRSRLCASSADMHRRIKKALNRFTAVIPEDFKAQVIEMRQKISEHFPARNFKKASGGLIEADFMLEYQQIVLKLRGMSFFQLFQKLFHSPENRSGGLEKLFEAFVFLRTLENSIRLLNHHDASCLPESSDSLTLIARKMGFSDSKDFVNAYQKARKHIEWAWNEFCVSE